MQVEGVSYNVNWKAFKRGSSIFIPCLDCKRGKKTVQEVLKRLQIKALFKTVIEDGIQGLRIWRL
jgi:hypothetical protein